MPGAKLVEREPPAIPEHHLWLEPSPRVTLGARTGQEHRNIISTYAVVSVFRATYISKGYEPIQRLRCPRKKRGSVCVATPELSDPESLSYGA